MKRLAWSGFNLRRGGRVVIAVRPVTGRNGSHITGWYWYGGGQNTYYSPVTTAEEAKAEAMQWVKSQELKLEERK